MLKKNKINICILTKFILYCMFNLKKIIGFRMPMLASIVNNTELNLEYFTEFFIINKTKIKSQIKTALIFSFLSLFLTSAKYSSNFVVVNSPDNESSSIGTTSILSQIAGVSSGSTINLSSVTNSNTFLDDIISINFFVDGQNLDLVEYYDLENSLNPKHFIYKQILSQKAFDEYSRTYTKNKILNSSNFSEDEFGIFRFQISTKSNVISYEVANAIMKGLNEFTIKTMQNNALEKRQYLEKRLSEVELVILSSEDRLNDFLDDNKNFIDSPKLQIEYNKLKTDVELNYQILKQLVLEIEILKSGELKDNAQLIVIEEPEITEFRSNTIVSLFLKHFVLIFIILFATSFFLFKRK
tara:strand:+ start:4036 stop:5100 length:1065 start_codon:yes stop_codon:yes gene_type:complete